MKIFSTILALLTFTIVLAGPGHDHGAPTFQAPKGGILKSTHTAHFELVNNKNHVSIFAYDEKGQNLPTKNFKISAELELPRKKSSSLQLEDKSTHWEVKIDPQNSHRYSLILKIDDGKEKDDVKFTVETK